MAIFSFRWNIFVRRMVKKKRRKSQILCNKEIRQDQCQDQFRHSSFATKEMKYV